jgi:Conjugal transfer protein TrbH
MKNTLLVILVSFVTGGCATLQGTKYGNLVPSLPVSEQQKVAEDAASKLGTLHSPARTKLHLQHAADDTFGTAIIDALRREGFGIVLATDDTSIYEESEERLRFGYLLDASNENKAVRVVIETGNTSLSRLYEHRDESLMPTSFWMYKE